MSARFAIGARVRIKPSEFLSELSEAEAEIASAYLGVYPSEEGATYYKIKLVKKRERCRYCGAPREHEKDPCVVHGNPDFKPDGHAWRDASTLDVHEDWLEAL